jgi:hypothetical protein
MLGIGVALLIVGYGLLYTGAMNLANGGKGPKLMEAFGVTQKLASPVDFKSTPQGSSNQTGQPATTAEAPATQKLSYT